MIKKRSTCKIAEMIHLNFQFLKIKTIIAINERNEMNSIEQRACTLYSIVTVGRFDNINVYIRLYNG